MNNVKKIYNAIKYREFRNRFNTKIRLIPLEQIHNSFDSVKKCKSFKSTTFGEWCDYHIEFKFKII